MEISAPLTNDYCGRTLRNVSERERLEYDPQGPSFVNDLARKLDEIVGPSWEGWHYGDSVPGAAMFARFVKSESGRYVLAGLLLLGDAITAEQLRKVPVTVLENSTNLSTEDAYATMHEELDRLAPLQRVASMSPEEFSRLVAEHFKVWARYVPHPAAAMAAEWKVKAPTVHTWIREARLRGLLPPARRGKAP